MMLLTQLLLLFTLVMFQTLLIAGNCNYPHFRTYVNCNTERSYPSKSIRCACKYCPALSEKLTCVMEYGYYGYYSNSYAWQRETTVCDYCSHCHPYGVQDSLHITGCQTMITQGYLGQTRKCICKNCPHFETTVKCNANSNWIEEANPSCQSRCYKCAPKTIPENVKCESAVIYGYVGEVKQCQCRNNCLGLKTKLICNESGDWKEDIIENCDRDINKTLEDSHVTLFYSNSELSTSCDDGYEMIDAGSLTCNDSKFQGDLPSCISDDKFTTSSTADTISETIETSTYIDQEVSFLNQTPEQSNITLINNNNYVSKVNTQYILTGVITSLIFVILIITSILIFNKRRSRNSRQVFYKRDGCGIMDDGDNVDI